MPWNFHSCLFPKIKLDYTKYQLNEDAIEQKCVNFSSHSHILRINVSIKMETRFDLVDYLPYFKMIVTADLIAFVAVYTHIF